MSETAMSEPELAVVAEPASAEVVVVASLPASSSSTASPHAPMTIVAARTPPMMREFFVSFMPRVSAAVLGGP